MLLDCRKNPVFGAQNRGLTTVELSHFADWHGTFHFTFLALPYTLFCRPLNTENIDRGVVLVGITLLDARGLLKAYSGRAVVNEVSIAIEQRSIVGLLGRNGAGKTTTFRMIMGMIAPDAGSVVFEGRDVTKLPMYRRARLGIGYLSQEPSIFQRLSVRDNLYAILETMSITKIERDRKADMLIDRFALTEVANSQGRFLSGGERRKLEIARAMVTDPSLILLDEPFSGVDPIAVQDLQEEIRRLVTSGVSILITDHNVERTLEVVDSAYIIDHGKVIGAGPPAEIIKSETVRKAYLGNTFAGDEFDEAHE
ncbi:MAG: LPS export ABC transporter ATP-binding protein [Phycisphaerales bacterium]|nr:MAG: LPS export ABC transporter ATP-binding protein [Phycisphaerales bacterium]